MALDKLPAMPAEIPPVSMRKQGSVALAALRGRRTGTAWPPGRPFLIYGQGRTGSTLLGSLLASHPQVVFGNEVLRGATRNPRVYLDGLRAQSFPSSYGAHVKPYHLTDFQRVRDVGGWLRLLHERGWLILHLQRTNTLRHVLSNFSRQANGLSHFRQGDGRASQRMTVDPDVLLHYIELRLLSRAHESEHLEGLPHLQIYYESHLLPGPDAWAQTTTTVFQALGLPSHPVDTSLRRINEAPLNELVLNWDDVREAIAASPYASLLPSLPTR